MPIKISDIDLSDICKKIRRSILSISCDPNTMNDTPPRHINFSTSPDWAGWKKIQAIQRLLGIVAASLFCVAFLALFDGLQEVMRTGNDQIDILAGEVAAVSGPCPYKNPVASDLKVEFGQKDTPLSFELEGFFAGYVFGGGMWRGHVTADANAQQGAYKMAARFKGTAAASAHKFTIVVWQDAAARQAGAYSLLHRWTGLPTLRVAAAAGIAGIIMIFVTYLLGRRGMACLTRLGLSEVFRVATDSTPPRLYCLGHGMPPRAGTICQILDRNGKQLARARVATFKKEVLEMHILTPLGLPVGSLVCLKEPEQPAPDND